MNKALVVLLGLLGSGIVIGLIIIMSVIGMNNSAVRMEKEIEAQYKQNQNSRSQLVNSVAEAAQVPDMYKDDFKEVVLGAMEGRYGKDGSKATFQWIQEHQINFDSSLYGKIQQMIDAGRARFAHEQELLIDKKRMYETKLETFPSGFVLSMLGFPKIDMDKFKIVTSMDNERVFAEGKEGPMKLR